MTGTVAPYLALVPPENNQQPALMAVVTMLTQPLADIVQVLQSIPSLYDLDTAVGTQLDTVGQWIGQTRYIEEAITDVYFSFDIVGLGFDQGVWAPNSATTVLTALPDDFYRLLLYAAVARNHWDGTVPNAEKYLNAFWNTLGYYEYVIDNQDMTVTFLLVGPPMNPLVAALYFGGHLDVVAAGVGVANHLWVDGSGGIPLVPIFGFDLETAFIAGFDVGYWDGAGGGMLNMSALLQGTGQFMGALPIPAPTDGTFAIFAIGAVGSGVVTNQFTYSGSTVASSTSLLSAMDRGAAAGNSIAGIFTMGYGTFTGATNSFTYSGMTVASSTSLNAAFGDAACGNSTEGIFDNGTATNTQKFTYSGAVVTTATTIGSLGGCGAGNSTDGFFALGGSVNTMKDFNYAGNTVGSTTSLIFSGGLNYGAATGNSTAGIFASGQGAMTTNKFTYTGATVATATALAHNSATLSAAGNSSVGIFTEGTSTPNTSEYTYSGDIVTTSTVLTSNSNNGAATSNGISGVTI